MLPEELARRRAAELVVTIWKKVIKKPFFRMAVGAKTIDNAVEFYALAQRTGVPIESLLKEGKDFYGADWCQETFGTPHPPLNVIIGPKCRRRLHNNHRPMVLAGESSLVSLAEEIAESIRSAVPNPVEQKAILDGGWPEDEKVRNLVRKILHVS